MHSSAAIVTDAVRPAALVERRQQTKKRAQHARDVAISAGYLTCTHIIAPLILASLLLHSHWTALGMIATIPVAVVIAGAYGYQQKRTPRKISWHFPNAIEAPNGSTWQFTQRDLIVNFRWWNHHTIWLRTLAGLGAAGLLATYGQLPLAGLASTVWLYWFLRKLGGKKTTHVQPWHAARIRAGMLETEVWGKKAADLPPFRHIRPMQSTEYGDTVWLSLHGKSHTKVTARQAEFVAGLGLRAREVNLSHDDTLPADAIQIRFLNGHPRAPRQHWALSAAKGET